MGKHAPKEQFDVVSKIMRQVSSAGKNPEKSLKELLRIARIYSSPDCDRGTDEKTQALKTLDDAAPALQKLALKQFPDNFQVNWLTARLMHRIGRNQDALTFLSAAEKLNDAVRGVAFRKAEILSDLHTEVPTNGYGREAFQIAASATYKYPSVSNVAFTAKIGWRVLTNAYQ